MPTGEQMLVRFSIALFLGAIIGWEREAAGKDAGIRTAMLVAGGASLYTMISLIMPSILGVDAKSFLSDRVAANIVVGVGFLGGGIIIKSGEHVRGLTTAAVVWMVAAIGMLVGFGLVRFAALVAIPTTGLLYVMRKLKLEERIRGEKVEKRECGVGE
jgi:putative Mg2+ transporter-C (MgtC) family protein